MFSFRAVNWVLVLVILVMAVTAFRAEGSLGECANPIQKRYLVVKHFDSGLKMLKVIETQNAHEVCQLAGVVGSAAMAMVEQVGGYMCLTEEDLEKTSGDI